SNHGASLRQGRAESRQGILPAASGRDDGGAPVLHRLLDGHGGQQLHSLSGHYVNNQMIQKGITIDGTKKAVHSLPVVVDVLPIEVGIEVPDPIERRTRGTPLDEP